MSNNQPQEGNATVAVEKKTSKIPSMVYLNDNMYGESREQENEMQNNPRTNANTNDLDSRSNSGDNSGMHAGGNQGSSYQRQQPENSSQYGSKTGSYWEEKGSDREQSAENRMNGQNPDKRH